MFGSWFGKFFGHWFGRTESQPNEPRVIRRGTAVVKEQSESVVQLTANETTVTKNG